MSFTTSVTHLAASLAGSPLAAARGEALRESSAALRGAADSPADDPGSGGRPRVFLSKEIRAADALRKRTSSSGMAYAVAAAEPPHPQVPPHASCNRV